MAVLKGTLDVLVLKTLSWSPMHAFEIAAWLEQESSGHVAVDDAALLQSLRRLEARKFLAAEWGVTKNNRRARYYRLTDAGRAQLREESVQLAEHLDALVGILRARKA